MALLLLRGFSTPSLLAQGEQRLPSYFNIDRDIPRPHMLVMAMNLVVAAIGQSASARLARMFTERDFARFSYSSSPRDNLPMVWGLPISAVHQNSTLLELPP
jgi:hypothetical protein